RLGINAPSSGRRPNAERIRRWSRQFPTLAAKARREADRRAQQRRSQLIDIAQELLADELEALAEWHSVEEPKPELMHIGGGQVTFEGLDAYEQRLRALEAEYDHRRSLIRDRSEIRVASIDLLGGRLIVEPVS